MNSSNLKEAILSLSVTHEEFLKQTGKIIYDATTYVLDNNTELDDLEACEKTYIGTKVEKRFLNHWSLPVKKKGSQHKLDTIIDNQDVDLKFSISHKGSWMIPPEARDEWCLLMNMKWPDTYSIGLLKMEAENLTKGKNRDGKVSVSRNGKKNIDWLGRDIPLCKWTPDCPIATAFNKAKKELFEQEKTSLFDIQAPRDPGVYALFHQDRLVYVGKTTKLRDRLRKHSRTIASASKIDNNDMKYACISHDEHFMVAIESYLIQNLQPAWNSTGFGSNAHGGGRNNQKQSIWNQKYGRETTK